MCGISGTIYKKRLIKGKTLSIDNFRSILTNINKNNPEATDLLNLVWEFKNNLNFINYCFDYDLRSDLTKFVKDLSYLIYEQEELIKKIDRNKKDKEYFQRLSNVQKLLDIKWFLEIEINRWIQDIEFISSKKVSHLEKQSIILYKDIISIIRSIDKKLELRGRDSFGISIQLHLENSYLIENISSTIISETNNCQTQILVNLSNKIINFSFKTFNKIGSLGENARIIKQIIKNTKLLHNIIKSEETISGVIVGHTRWASVGAVNIENTHPVFCTTAKGKQKHKWSAGLLNGDIYNYKDFINMKDNNKIFEKNCSTDCLAVPLSLLDKTTESFKNQLENVNNFEGSFTISYFDSVTNNLSVFKRGSQGLYIGVSQNQIMFASDVYGLIEFCRYFYPVKSEECFVLSAKEQYQYNPYNIEIYNLNNQSNINIQKKDFKETIITSRDIDQKNYEYFLEKEIYDTKDIVQSTVNRNIKNSLNIDSSNYNFSIGETQVPSVILKNIKNKTIRKIFITGMGTCYTASITIANYMRIMLKKINPNIIVEPTIASEGSGFYIEPEMSDVLVIVIAQSGTTIDTNIYAKMAKDRGAFSLAIANKREGDVTFIVDGTLYIGEGRDIEISVPSTKTYTAQVILGYILSLFILKNVSRKLSIIKLVDIEIKKIIQCPQLIDQTLDNFKNINKLELQMGSFLEHVSWIVSYDQSENSVCASEIRIKLSETCYQSVPYLHIKQVLEYKIKDSLIIFVSNNQINNIEKDITNLLNNYNTVIAITPILNKEVNCNLNKYIKNNSLIIITFPKSYQYFSFIPTIMVGQYFSYTIAKLLDKRSKDFYDLKHSSFSLKTKETECVNIIEKNLSKGFYNIGINKKKVRQLINIARSNKEESYNCILDQLISESRRTIDTIKHQAKTITVGAVRSNFELQDKTNYTFDQKPENKKIFGNVYNNCLFLFSKKEQNQFNKIETDNVFLTSDLDESYVYNIINFIAEIEKKIKSNYVIKLAQDYDKSQGIKDLDNTIIYLNFKNSKKQPENNYNHLFFRNFKSDNFILKILSKYKYINIDINKVIWALCVSILLVEKLIISKLPKKQQNTSREKINFMLIKNFNALNIALKSFNSNQFLKSRIKNSVETYISKQNWKCIGSGVNYNFAKFAAKKIMMITNRSCAFDVLENHKHIDISAESCLLVFIANIDRAGYQSDAFSEIQKMLSHNNHPIIITNENDDRFDKMFITEEEENITKKIDVIKVPKVSEEFIFFLNSVILDLFLNELKLRLKR